MCTTFVLELHFRPCVCLTQKKKKLYYIGCYMYECMLKGGGKISFIIQENALKIHVFIIKSIKWILKFYHIILVQRHFNLTKI